jgi:hypothetical protein
VSYTSNANGNQADPSLAYNGADQTTSPKWGRRYCLTGHYAAALGADQLDDNDRLPSSARHVDRRWLPEIRDIHTSEVSCGDDDARHAF